MEKIEKYNHTCSRCNDNKNICKNENIHNFSHDCCSQKENWFLKNKKIENEFNQWMIV